ncbi:alcohol dehydrogenase catalytic domain-containing protein [Schaalia sp. lx-260]|uniref:alcohol dehydrogenase catalytic domain-containing protein n=1 Tax=Schaalia sp. lx-260 TaxID=2899082 RepID=UPI001E46CD70|nr:alcohol dehydrogenase catalytic domain-containing protein [Schaalia sp. lx-260]MCD4550308.1 alcohol dehydrogenase catalytic domain-containing protein [Schaalia sp. lx-260]
MTTYPESQYAIQIVGADDFIVNTEKPVDAVGPHQMMLKVEACGICFSDTKLLHAFDTHPRKAEVISGIDPQALKEIPGYKPSSLPTVPGHEPVGRIVEVGDQVTHFKVGDRVLVQADWKHLRTAKSNGAFGYNFEGALQEYVVLDERCVVSPSGEEFLIHVSEGPSAAAVGLIEPWATVEGSYAWRERNHVADDGRLLVVGQGDISGLVAEHLPAEIVSVSEAEALGLADQTFDDIVYFGANADVIEALSLLLGTRAVMCVVLGGTQIDRKVSLDIGRVHYDFIRFCGTTGDDPRDGYAWIPATGELREGDRVAIIGAAGPMGQMHTMRAVTSGVSGISVAGTDVSDERLEGLRAVVGPVAASRGVPLEVINTGVTPLQAGYTHLSCMVPVPALVSQAVDLAAQGAIINAFAGIPAGTFGDFDLQGIIERHIFMLGTSGSDVSDMRTVLRKIEDGIIDTTISLYAVTGMAGFSDAIHAVMNRTSGGKIMVFPSLHDLGLTPLSELADTLPQVAALLKDGLWTKEAEEALLATASSEAVGSSL